MKRAYRHQETEEFEALADINVTPLVDVFLVLLVIFMITAPVIKTALEMGLPQAKTAVADPSQGITVKVLTDRTVWIDDERVSVEAFPSRFRAIWAEKGENEKRPVFLAADESVPYGDIIFVLDELRVAGVENLGMLTKGEREYFNDPVKSEKKK
ncbi:MAG: biopolymer transporter ExbD [Candidatus Electryonea clarkiae]|nr:biopolymer transporter ExbD [Candidatus Electryonea clarkiae]MDP8289343.1 biopolymer transporter ExbD [Candidatus Electryonea clarkiae]